MGQGIPGRDSFLMAVYLDDARHPYRGMILCHMWADSREELLAMADRIGMDRRWLQEPPKASWVHFDVSLGMKARALAEGAILTDRYGPALHTARLRGDRRMIRMIGRVRARRLRDKD